MNSVLVFERLGVYNRMRHSEGYAVRSLSPSTNEVVDKFTLLFVFLKFDPRDLSFCNWD